MDRHHNNCLHEWIGTTIICMTWFANAMSQNHMHQFLPPRPIPAGLVQVFECINFVDQKKKECINFVFLPIQGKKIYKNERGKCVCKEGKNLLVTSSI